MPRTQCFYADEDAIAPLWKGSRFPRAACISGWAMDHGQATVVPDIYADDRIPHDAYRPTFVKSLVMVPIRAGDPLGAIGTYWAQPRAPSVEDVELLQALADSTAIAIEHVQLLADLETRVIDRTSELEERMAELRELEQQRQHLAADLMAAEERERTRLSEIVHDDVLQFVLAARQELAEAAKGDPSALATAADHLDAVNRRLRFIVRDLSPAALHSTTLSEAIRSVVRGHVEATGVLVTTELDDSCETDQAALILRATRELLTNARKHAHATSCRVRLLRDDHGVELIVADDGTGMDLAALDHAVRAGHVGLASIRNRAKPRAVACSSTPPKRAPTSASGSRPSRTTNGHAALLSPEASDQRRWSVSRTFRS